MTGLPQIIIGAFILSIIHASIPNHWIPLVVIGKTEKWSLRETLSVTAISGFAHTLSTIIIGIIVGLIGYKLSESYSFVTRIAAPLILIVLGIIYLIIDFKVNRHHHRHHHQHIDVNDVVKQKTKAAIIASLAVGMFFSPCIEIEAYYFAASSLGWLGILSVSLIYLFITITGMLLLVFLAGKGMEKLKWHFIEHHEKLTTGIVLIVLGVLAFFIKY